jgi:hypothetical protein
MITTVGLELLGLLIAVLINPNMKDPSPKLPIMIPLINPFLCGTISHKHTKGTMYPNPIPVPYKEQYMKIKR